MTASAKKRKYNAKADSNDIQDMVEEFGQKYHCDSCNKDVTHLIIVRCAVCTDFDLCITCFSTGVELNQHEKTHDYRVIVNIGFRYLT
jgi:transcriptional adapter 2-alpha